MPDAAAEMSLRYEGPAVDAGAMDVRALAPALIAAADAMREAHVLLEVPGPPPRVEVRATRPGSFAIDLLVAETLYERAVALFTSRPVDAVGGLMGLIGAVISSVGVVKHIRNRKINEIQDSDPDVIVLILEDGTRIEVPSAATLRLVASGDYRRALRGMVEPMVDGSITSLTLSAGNQAETVTADDLGAFNVPPAREEDLGQSETEVVLRPVSVAFTEGNKWRFSDGDATFFATIEDPKFLADVNMGVERFAKNDMLRVMLRTRQTRDASGLHVERAVMQVKAHIPGAIQLDLFTQSEESSASAGQPAP
jgi:hypothetical protein